MRLRPTVPQPQLSLIPNIPAAPRSFFAFHGKIEEVVVRDSVGYLQFSDSAAAQSALLFDKSNFLGNAISVEVPAQLSLSCAPASDPHATSAPRLGSSLRARDRARHCVTTVSATTPANAPATTPAIG